MTSKKSVILSVGFKLPAYTEQGKVFKCFSEGLVYPFVNTV